MQILNHLQKRYLWPNPEFSYTIIVSHQPSGYCLLIKSIIPDINIKPVIYTMKNENEDISLQLVQSLKECVKEIYQEYYESPKKW